MDQPLVSVIVPTFQRADIIGRAIDSVLNQTYSNWELVVMDDGSTDNTCEVVSRYQTATAKCRYYFQPNQGVGPARNAGVALARGEYIACLDSDDQYAPDHLSSRVGMLINEALDLIQGGIQIMGEPVTVDFFKPTELIRLENCVIGGSFIGRTEVFLQSGFPDLRYGEDTEFWSQAAQRFRVKSVVEPRTYVLHETPGSLRLERMAQWLNDHPASPTPHRSGHA